jgi:hypothetical protein
MLKLLLVVASYSPLRDETVNLIGGAGVLGI